MGPMRACRSILAVIEAFPSLLPIPSHKKDKEGCPSKELLPADDVPSE